MGNEFPIFISEILLHGNTLATCGSVTEGFAGQCFIHRFFKYINFIIHLGFAISIKW